MATAQTCNTRVTPMPPNTHRGRRATPDTLWQHKGWEEGTATSIRTHSRLVLLLRMQQEACREDHGMPPITEALRGTSWPQPQPTVRCGDAGSTPYRNARWPLNTAGSAGTGCMAQPTTQAALTKMSTHTNTHTHVDNPRPNCLLLLPHSCPNELLPPCKNNMLFPHPKAHCQCTHAQGVCCGVVCV